MRPLKLAAACCLLFSSIMTGSAKADVITVGGGWDAFSFGDVGPTFSTDFDFTLTKTAVFKLTDAFLDGDQFALSTNGGPFIATSVPVNDGTQVGNDYDAAYASPKYSHATYILGPGSYNISGTVLQSPFGGGGAAAELVASGVPELSTWGMMLVGFAGLSLFAYRRSRERLPDPLLFSPI